MSLSTAAVLLPAAGEVEEDEAAAADVLVFARGDRTNLSEYWIFMFFFLVFFPNRKEGNIKPRRIRPTVIATAVYFVVSSIPVVT